MGEGRTEPHIQRLTASQAAEQWGVATEAIRGRIRRETIRHERVGGRVYVLLSEERPTDQAADQSELVEELRRTNELLREVITTRDEEIRRRDTIIMNMTEAMMALNPPSPEDSSEARESPEPGEEQQGRGPHSHPATGGAQGGSRRPWWRRMLGG